MTSGQFILVCLILIFYLLGALATMMALGPQGYFEVRPRRRMLEVICIWWFIVGYSTFNTIFLGRKGR